MNPVKILIMIIASTSILQLTACNTVAGLGKDVQKGGQAIEKSVR